MSGQQGTWQACQLTPAAVPIFRMRTLSAAVLQGSCKELLCAALLRAMEPPLRPEL